ncbi:MAG TPA: SagB/ThcOx family dehydrogenase [Thermomicrobiales bacterium]|nr:SagB/ThcOx family dehydrogenase [Thermomicrobiales bacterium]
MSEYSSQLGAERPAGSAVRRYHETTNHLIDTTRLGEQYAGSMDEALRPRLYKLYPTLSPIPLPQDLQPSTTQALDAIADATGAGAPGEQIPDLSTLARLLLLTDGVIRRVNRGGREVEFRAAPCTGALYHEEIYLVCGDLPGLPAGVYHYGVHDHALRRLRDGDYRAHLVEASGGEPALVHAPAILVTTSVFWRNAWKYLNRAYRHTYWDTGTMLPNTLAAAATAGLPARLVLAFADELVATLLGVDLDQEGVISLVALGRTTNEPPPAPPIDALALPTEPYSVRELDLPLIRETHRATLLRTGEAAAQWRSIDSDTESSPAPASSLIALPAPGPMSLPRDPFEDLIRRRRSTRRFSHEPVTQDQLSTLLDRTTRGVPSDSLGPEGIPFNTAYLIVNAVEGLTPGAYVYHREAHALELLHSLTEDETRERSSALALGQDAGGDAAVNIYFLSDLDLLLERYGDRGYRLAHLGGALVAGKLYVIAYALGLGSTGLTFFDDAVIDFFAPHAAGKSVMFLVAIGVPRRKT